MIKKQRRSPLPEMTATQQKTRKNNIIVHAVSQPGKLLAAPQAGPVTTVDAVYGFFIPHPSSVVHLLRLQGHRILTVLRPTEFPDGREAWCAVTGLRPEGATSERTSYQG